MTPTPEPLHPPGTEIARLTLPLPVPALAALTKALEKAYGKGLRMRQEGAWCVLTTPTRKHLELDRRREHASKAALPNPNRCKVCGGILAPPKGVTYLAQRQQWIKIGRTDRSVSSRIKRLNTNPASVTTPTDMDSAEPLVLVHTIDHDIEHQLHEQFAAHHAVGEWFAARPVLDWLEDQQ